MVTVSSEKVTFESLSKFFEELGYEKCKDIDDNIYYKKIDSFGNVFKYSFKRTCGDKYLYAYNKYLQMSYDLSHCAYFTYDDDEIKYPRLGFWFNLEEMQRCIEDKMNPGDEADIIIDGKDYGSTGFCCY